MKTNFQIEFYFALHVNNGVIDHSFRYANTRFVTVYRKLKEHDDDSYNFFILNNFQV